MTPTPDQLSELRQKITITITEDLQEGILGKGTIDQIISAITTYVEAEKERATLEERRIWLMSLSADGRLNEEGEALLATLNTDKENK